MKKNYHADQADNNFGVLGLHAQLAVVYDKGRYNTLSCVRNQRGTYCIVRYNMY